MLVRKFTCLEHEEFGELGWRPDWLKHLSFDPSWDFGIAHDILEHMVDKIGGAEGELMAYGAIFWGRGESGWFFYRQLSGIESGLASDFAYMLNTIASGKETLRCPGRTYKLRDYDHVEKEMEDGIRKAIKEFKKEGNYLIEEVPAPEHDIVRRAVGWMRKGFRKAQKYYTQHNLDSHSVSYLFDRIAEIVKSESNDMMEGEVLTIRINPKTCEVSGFKDYPYS